MFEKLFKVLQGHDTNLKKPRWPCPFYGFYSSRSGMFIDQEDNQCGLVRMGRVCQMEYCLSGPNWVNCSLNCKDAEQRISGITRYSTIFPNEFFPPGKNQWEGMSMSEWMDYVMDPTTPRPKASKTAAETAG